MGALFDSSRQLINGPTNALSIVRVLLCGVKPEFLQKLKRTGLIDRVRDRIFLEQPVRQTSTLLAIRHAYEILKDPCERCPRRDAAKRDQALHFEI